MQHHAVQHDYHFSANVRFRRLATAIPATPRHDCQTGAWLSDLSVVCELAVSSNSSCWLSEQTWRPLHCLATTTQYWCIRWRRNRCQINARHVSDCDNLFLVITPKYTIARRRH